MLLVRSLVLALLLVSGVQAQELPSAELHSVRAQTKRSRSRSGTPCWRTGQTFSCSRVTTSTGTCGTAKIRDEDEIIEGLDRPTPQAAHVPGLTALRASVPHLATWDDHDYGRNDGGEEFVHKRAPEALCRVLAAAGRGPAIGAKASITRRCLAHPGAACRSSCWTRASSAPPSSRRITAVPQARSAMCRTPIRRRPCWAPQWAWLAERLTARGRAPRYVVSAGRGGRPRMGALGQPTARAPALVRLGARFRCERCHLPVGRPPCRRDLP